MVSTAFGSNEVETTYGGLQRKSDFLLESLIMGFAATTGIGIGYKLFKLTQKIFKPLDNSIG